MLPRRTRFALFFVLIFSLAIETYAEDDEIAGTVVLVSVGSGAQSSQTVQRVVRSSIEVYLEQQGVVTARTDSTPEGEELDRTLAREARGADADFVLTGDVTTSGNDVTVRLRLYLADEAQMLAEATGTEEVGLTLDRAIAGLTGNLLERARPYLVAAASRRGEIAREIAAAEESPVPERRIDLFVVEASYSPFLPIAGAADYIDFSFAGASATMLSLPFARDIVGLGISARGIIGEASGVATSAGLELLPFGITARFSALPAPYVPYLRLTGGAALIRASHPVLGTFSSIVPYAGGEFGLRLELFGFLGLQAFVGFDAIMESSLWILGFSPGIGLAMGF